MNSPPSNFAKQQPGRARHKKHTTSAKRLIHSLYKWNQSNMGQPHSHNLFQRGKMNARSKADLALQKQHKKVSIRHLGSKA